MLLYYPGRGRGMAKSVSSISSNTAANITSIAIAPPMQGSRSGFGSSGLLPNQQSVPISSGMVMQGMSAGRGNIIGPNAGHNQAGFPAGHLPANVMPPHGASGTGMDTGVNPAVREQMTIIDNPVAVRNTMAMPQQQARRIIWSGM